MNSAVASNLFRGALWTAVVVGGPLLGVMTVVAVVTGILQAATQVQDSSVSFTPKVAAAVGANFVRFDLDDFDARQLYAQGVYRDPMDSAAVNLTVGNDIALAFVLVFARVGSVMMALPSLLGERYRSGFACCWRE